MRNSLLVFFTIFIGFLGRTQEFCSSGYKYPINCSEFDTVLFVNDIGVISVEYFSKTKHQYMGLDVFAQDSIIIERIRLNRENNTSVRFLFENGILLNQSTCIGVRYCNYISYYPIINPSSQHIKSSYQIDSKGNYQGWYITYYENQVVQEAKYYVNGKWKKKKTIVLTN